VEEPPAEIDMVVKNELAHLLPAARSGSEQALGKILEASQAYLLWITRRELSPDFLPRSGGSDLVQETFLEAHRDFASFRGESDAELLAWLRRLLRNNIANCVRHHQAAKRGAGRVVSLSNRHAELAADDSGQPGDALERADEVAMFTRLANGLPADSRHVITRWYGGQSFPEIALEMGRTVNAVRMVWARAVGRLQKAATTELGC
jgi:RNA polymerase sigma-70 factor, ECF subfamily